MTLMTSGAETPVRPMRAAVTMREFFHKNILFSRAEPLEQSTRSDMATSASSATRGEVSTDFAASEPSFLDVLLGADGGTC